MRDRSLLVSSLIFALALVALFGAAAGLCLGCQPLPPAPPPPYDPTSCSDACGHARALCGPTTLTPRKGGTCEDVCKATEEGGGDFRTGCLSAAATCPDVKACSR